MSSPSATARFAQSIVAAALSDGFATVAQLAELGDGGWAASSMRALGALGRERIDAAGRLGAYVAPSLSPRARGGVGPAS